MHLQDKWFVYKAILHLLNHSEISCALTKTERFLLSQKGISHW